MKPLNKIISGYMNRITFILVAMILVFLLLVQLLTEQRRAIDDSYRTLMQIEQVLVEHQSELAEMQVEYRQTCLHNAETVARIIESNTDVMNNVDELKKIAESVEIDEIHIFDNTGRIFAGTHPQYYDLTFDSGEQMMFFKPMLEDKSLKLVQDITPNTAEEKPMQYSAIWSENSEIIIQVGMEPVNVMKVTEKNELSYIFSLLRVNPDVHFYAIDCASGEIVGATDMNSVGMKASDKGFDMERVETDPDGFHTEINGKTSFCVFLKSGSNYIGRVVAISNIYRRVPMTVFWVALSLFTVAFILARIVVLRINKYVVQGIHDVNEKLHSISDGNLEETVEIRNSTELSELSDHINMMVRSLLENNKRMSYVLKKTNLHIGTYEYIGKENSVRYTELIPIIFGADEDTMKKLSSDTVSFMEFLENVCSNPVPNENNVYMIKDRYVRIEETENDGSIFGVAVDVTDEINKRREIERERDIDTLTGLYNRRGLDSKLDELLANPEEMGHSAIVMIDADGLKIINDTYGHEKGDIYLKKIANIINNFGIKSSIAARQGGDEFILFLYDYDSEVELMRTIETLRYIQANSTAALDKKITVPLRFSLGYCLADGNSDYQQLFKKADELMYKDKTERKKQLALQNMQ